jgi:hypothetical protein
MEATCKYIHVTIVASPQEGDLAYQKANPGGAQVDLSNFPPVYEYTTNGNPISFNNTPFLPENPIAASAHINYGILDPESIENGVYNHVERQLFVKITVRGMITDSEGEIRSGHCCEKVYWVRGFRDEDTTIETVPSVVSYHRGQAD